MSGETGVVVHRRGRAEIARLARSYRASGLGRSEFCRHHGLALSTLSRHLRKQFEEEARRDSDVVGRSPLVEVKVAEVVNPVCDVDRVASLNVLLSNGRRVEIGDGFDEQTLRRLVAVLERS
jgi:DNA-binding transcriptional ArsR family regulator